MAKRITELTPENTKKWPATPSRRMLKQTMSTLEMMQAIEGLTGHSVHIPAMTPLDERPNDLITVTGPNGEKTFFNTYHARRIELPEMIFMKDWKVYDAQALHDCMQAGTFSQACADLFHRTNPSGPDETMWFLTTAANLGDSTHTIGIAIQRKSDVKGKDETVVTKVPRHEHLMGYNHDLQNLEGLTLRVYGALDVPYLPSFAIAAPSDREFEGPKGQKIKPDPKKEVGMLAKIALHHGADQCLWFPAETA